jgi:Mn2+/Fe2+ NRAMP family transporter
MTEIAIIGCDIQEVLGSAIALKIICGIPLYAGALITMADTFTFLFIHIYGVRKLEFFFAFLICVMAACFYLNMFIVLPAAEDVFGGFIPYIPAGAGTATIGLVGAVIMPHNLYLHSALVLSRDVDTSNHGKIKEANMYFAIEAGLSLFVSFLINLAVISVFAHFEGEDDSVNGLESAGNALNTFGNGSQYIWAVGLLAAGQSSTMTGTYAGQFVMQGFLDLKMVAWKRVLLTRSIAMVPALGVAFAENPDAISQWLNIL